VNYIHDKFKPPLKYRPVHLLDIEHHYPHENSSNAEAPFSTEEFFWRQMLTPTYYERHLKDKKLTNPRRSFGNMKPIIFDWTRRMLHEIKDNTVSYHAYMYYILLHNKTAIINKDDPNKLRTISGFPRPANLAFIMFYWPLFAHYKRNPGLTPLLWGYETQKGGMLRLNYELFREYARSTIVTLDKSRFDKYYMFEVQDDIDNMCYNWIDFNHGYIPTKEYPHTDTTWNDNKADRLRRLFWWTAFCFRNAPTVLFDGRQFRRKWFGMPSGVYTTQFFDTLHFGITNATTLFVMGFTPQQIVVYKGEGDDIIFKLAVLIPPNVHDTFLQEYQRIDDEYFGSIIRPEKCKATNHIDGWESLGYTNHRGIPLRDTVNLMAQFYHTKMTNPTPSKTMATALGIATASLAIDRRVYNVCKEVYTYYESQGVTPNSDTYRRTLWTGDPTEHIKMPKTFPSIPEIQANVWNFSYSAPPTMALTWPSWFTAQF